MADRKLLSAPNLFVIRRVVTSSPDPSGTVVNGSNVSPRTNSVASKGDSSRPYRISFAAGVRYQAASLKVREFHPEPGFTLVHFQVVSDKTTAPVSAALALNKMAAGEAHQLLAVCKREKSGRTVPCRAM